MSIIGLIFAAAIAGAPAGADSTITITTTQANQWAGSTVDVEAWDRPEISVEQEVNNGNPGDVSAEVSRNGKSLTVTAVYTGAKKTYFFGLVKGSWNESFHWTVHVPATRPLTVDVSNGRVSITNVTAPLVATTSNGRIRIDGAGPILEARTANGEIDAAIGTLAGGPPSVKLRSSNGRIALHVPSAFRTRVDASTSNGHIDNPLSDGGGPGSASARTSNGSIEITVGS
ncbi:MAG: DUF4097 family beta strand repeat protein [Candidatus Eremiobacteraeota bacterium]|nr:DUF4097 family beta strand repeat protein [Candidatus Eremiobacteraeota bacterium]